MRFGIYASNSKRNYGEHSERIAMDRVQFLYRFTANKVSISRQSMNGRTNKGAYLSYFILLLIIYVI